MQLILNKNLKNFLIVFILSVILGYFFSTVYDFGQRAVDSALVHSGLVSYPNEISPMKEYFLKSWTLLHQISNFFLVINWSFTSISKFLIFLITIIYFIGITLAFNSATKSIYLSVLVSLMILVFQKNFGDTDYPTLFFSEHSYGMFSLAITTCIFGCLLSGNLFFAGLLTSVLISVHPIVGIWMLGIILFSLAINKFFLKFTLNKKNILIGLLSGIIITSISLAYHFVSMGEFSSSFDPESYNNYMQYWEGHRNESNYHFEYFIKTLVLFVFGVLCIKGFNDKFDENFKFGIICILFSIILSTFIYFLFKFFNPYIPDLILRIMPTRFATLYSVIGWPLILGILFILTKEFSKKAAYILIIFIITSYGISHHKVFFKLHNLFIKNTSNQIESIEEKNFWNDIKEMKSSGYILTTYSTSIISMRKSFKPILLDVTSFDFVPYYPNTSKNLSRIIENVYGISFDNPPPNIANRPFILDEEIKLIFENYSEEKWKKISNDYNLFGIIVPANWNINLSLSSKNQKFAFYIL